MFYIIQHNTHILQIAIVAHPQFLKMASEHILYKLNTSHYEGRKVKIRVHSKKCRGNTNNIDVQAVVKNRQYRRRVTPH
jgi:hypothetical protein